LELLCIKPARDHLQSTASCWLSSLPSHACMVPMNLCLVPDMAADGPGERRLVGRKDAGLTAQRIRHLSISGARVVRASGAGPAFHNFNGATETKADGSYELLVNSEEAYVIKVVDERWAAPSRIGVVVREDQPVENVDFTLAEGTVLRGTVTVGPARRCCNRAFRSCVGWVSTKTM